MATLKAHFEQQRAALDARGGPSAAQPGPDPAGSAPLSPYAWCWPYVWSQVRHAVVHSLAASEAYMRSGLDRAMAHTFELLGFDLLVDEQFRVHLVSPVGRGKLGAFALWPLLGAVCSRTLFFPLLFFSCWSLACRCCSAKSTACPT